MDITFVQKGQSFNGKVGYEVEFTADNSFNLHIERNGGGKFLVYQKSIQYGEYDVVDGIAMDHKDVIDFFVQVPLAPMYVKIVSETEVTRGVVIFAE